MKLDIKQVLHLFDEKSEDNKLKGHATSVVGFLGEDLNAAVFAHYGKLKGAKVSLLPDKVTTGRQKGPRLDRWILWQGDKSVLYQTEIKSWSSWAIGSKPLLLTAEDYEIEKAAKEDWERELKQDYYKRIDYGKVSKVLKEMIVPEGFRNIKVEPLVIHWRVINPNDIEPFSRTSIKQLKLNGKFKTDFFWINYFSVSLYLRKLLKNDEKYIGLELPSVEERLKIVKSLFRKNDPPRGETN